MRGHDAQFQLAGREQTGTVRPMTVQPSIRAKASARMVSCTGMPSVIAVTSSIPPLAASMMESPAANPGTNNTEVDASCSASASRTLL